MRRRNGAATAVSTAIGFALALFCAHATAGCDGPEPTAGRASSGYLVWIDGRSRVLVDAGGGVFLRFGDAGARIEDLDLVAISHFHADHVADVPALVKAGFFSDRERALAISGPSAGGEFPGLSAFLRAQFQRKGGAFAYLGGALDGKGQFPLRPVVEVRVPSDTPQTVLALPDLNVRAAPVKHGPVPSLGYVVESKGRRIAFGGDQNGDSPVFWALARGADLLVAHSAIADDSDPVALRLHATPDTIGRAAAAAGVHRVVLSHWMKRSLAAQAANVAAVRARFDGPVEAATDLACYRVGD